MSIKRLSHDSSLSGSTNLHSTLSNNKLEANPTQTTVGQIQIIGNHALKRNLMIYYNNGGNESGHLESLLVYEYPALLLKNVVVLWKVGSKFDEA